MIWDGKKKDKQMMHNTPRTARKSRLIGSALFGISLLTLSACTSAPARDADIFYDLRPEIGAVTFGSDKVLKVQSVSIKGLQSGRPLVIETAQDPVQFQDLRGHLWHEAPASLIETALVDALIAASQDLVIGTSDTVENEDYRLKLVISKFHFTPGQSAYLAFDSVVKDKRGKIISTTRHALEEPISGPNTQQAVAALEIALTKAIMAITKDIAAAL